jgi:nucleoside diphosphate kinase
MELRIKWTDFSKNELKNIFEYYKEIAGGTLAKKLVSGITKETLKPKKLRKLDCTQKVRHYLGAV